MNKWTEKITRFWNQAADLIKAQQKLKKQPTVDTVPVEWIESYVRDASATGDFSDEMCALAIEAMLNDWMEETGRERRI